MNSTTTARWVSMGISLSITFPQYIDRMAPRLSLVSRLMSGNVYSGIDFDRQVKDQICEAKSSDVVLWNSKTR
jgi:hypothetical protein